MHSCKMSEFKFPSDTICAFKSPNYSTEQKRRVVVYFCINHSNEIVLQFTCMHNMGNLVLNNINKYLLDALPHMCGNELSARG